MRDKDEELIRYVISAFETHQQDERLFLSAWEAFNRITTRLADMEAERDAFSNNVEQCEAENDRLRSRLAEAEALLEARRIVDRHPVVAAIDAFLRREP